MARLVTILLVIFTLVLGLDSSVLAKGGGGGHSGRSGHGSSHGGDFRLFDDHGGRHGAMEVERHRGADDSGRHGSHHPGDDGRHHGVEDRHFHGPDDSGHLGRRVEGLPWLRHGEVEIEPGIGHR